MGERPTLTRRDLERWVDNGALWRALEVSDERVVVQLCSCSGEPVDVLSGGGPALIAYVREHADGPEL